MNGSLHAPEEGHYPGTGPPTGEWAEKTPLGQAIQKGLDALQGGLSYSFFIEYRRSQVRLYLKKRGFVGNQKVPIPCKAYRHQKGPTTVYCVSGTALSGPTDVS